MIRENREAITTARAVASVKADAAQDTSAQSFAARPEGIHLVEVDEDVCFDDALRRQIIAMDTFDHVTQHIRWDYQPAIRKMQFLRRARAICVCPKNLCAKSSQ